jgi:hypothetical protein
VVDLALKVRIHCCHLTHLLHPSPWRTSLIAFVAAIPFVPLIISAIATAGCTLATTGRLRRWLPETGLRRALAAPSLSPYCA